MLLLQHYTVNYMEFSIKKYFVANNKLPKIVLTSDCHMN